MESINVVIKDTSEDRFPDVESDVGTSVQETNAPIQDHVSTSKGPSIRVQKNHAQELIIWNPNQGMTTKISNEVISNSCFVSKVEPKNVKEALTDELWIQAMQEELN